MAIDFSNMTCRPIMNPICFSVIIIVDISISVDGEVYFNANFGDKTTADHCTIRTKHGNRTFQNYLKYQKKNNLKNQLKL